jgi:hypothetical protein
VDKATIPVDAEATTAAEAENLSTTLSEIYRHISNVVAEKDVAEMASNKGDNQRNLFGKYKFRPSAPGRQQLSEEDISELKEFAISYGYQPGSMLFGGVDEEIVGCILDRAGAKIISTLS